LPSVDSLLRHPDCVRLLGEFGHQAVVEAVRGVIAAQRERFECTSANQIAHDVALRLDRRAQPDLRRVFNLTGTVLHTNLGRAQLSEAAVAQAAMAMRQACNLEFDLDTGGRGERDSSIERLLVELTGAEAATLVNNNAAAVLLVLAALAEGRELVLSRGELIEIGGSFRIPDVMRAAHVRLVEVGTTNRTHPQDYRGAIGPDTAALMKVHTSNYRITGFTAAVAEAELAGIAHDAGLPLIVDLGAGSLIDLATYGLPREPVVRDVIAAGADVVTFSGDKLLGGPQAGLIVGRRELIDRIRRHPLKRALRLSKITLAALEATLLAYRTPDFLTRDLPTLRLLTRGPDELAAMAQRIGPLLAAALGPDWVVSTVAVHSQIGSGSMPGEEIPSIALAVASASGSGKALQRLVERWRGLPVPVIGRVADGRLLFDLRCLEDEAGFVGQFGLLQDVA
jgi:L-seryl-tRNA(Ser) seleniumtransferase